MRTFPRLLLSLALGAVAGGGAVPAAIAQSYPTRPIELIVPYSPGGGSGITSETMKKIVAEENLSSQPITITYKPGASGQVGWTYLATRKGDGHSIATATASFSLGMANGQMQVGIDDFTPIALMLVDTHLIAASTQSGFKSMKEVIEAAKKKPGSVKAGGTGAAGTDANVLASLSKAAGIELNFIPFSSGGEVNAAILGGHIDVALGNPNELAGYIADGKLVALASFSEERLAPLGNVPTMREVGYDVVSQSGRGIVAPAGIPAEAKAYLVELMRKITQSPQWKDYADKNIMSVVFRGGDDFDEYLAAERARFAEMVKANK